MDRTKVSGTLDVGSIPAGATPITLPDRQGYLNLRDKRGDRINRSVAGGSVDKSIAPENVLTKIFSRLTNWQHTI